jgi:hypothetical protein
MHASFKCLICPSVDQRKEKMKKKAVLGRSHKRSVNITGSRRGTRRLTKEKVLLSLIVASLIFYVFMFFTNMNSVTNVSAVEANGVGVYWDSDCSDGVSSIDWGILEPGSVKNITVYIRNEGEEQIRLDLTTTNWNPPKALQYLNLGWNYTKEQRIDPTEALQVTLTLSVRHYIEGISSFSFDILITERDIDTMMLGDLNGDGKIDDSDVLILATAFGSTPEDENWNPQADLNEDSTVNYKDLLMLAVNYGK